MTFQKYLRELYLLRQQPMVVDQPLKAHNRRNEFDTHMENDQWRFNLRELYLLRQQKIVDFKWHKALLFYVLIFDKAANEMFGSGYWVILGVSLFNSTFFMCSNIKNYELCQG